MNSFTSVSLEQTQRQEPVAWAFAGRRTVRIEGVPHHRATLDLPVLSEAPAHPVCRLVTEYDGGDHAILLGEVVGLGAPSDADRRTR